ncbi:MAG: 4-alpha-glucanotransferase [candidate division KSB1 bacterium]|nr:4-alpha-glucanotransferase [candidate division KSB1 bacterium]MDZ7273440.1 4-alpha-glucanotransferase [candidate division KSB1 bacterium]MDZ7286968.1 4-alpha-glucanotransferase [candidate division KSB1 bacterium]MDZ7299679.1 4-alpha-glucanotransferase [candidate division KSB1 bacterium]MDZ7307943.1 4-alpha-glucanotransferase [candidate division KSB1 bacterium]
MIFARSSGVLLHPTSLPGRLGIGDLGAAAYAFVDALAGMSQHLWQVLPLGPTGYANSPYQSFSAFAGNPLLISLERLVDEEWLPPARLEAVPDFPAARVDYGRVIQHRLPLLHEAAAIFQAQASTFEKKVFEEFCEREAAWLEDYALFMALKEVHALRPWTTWPPELVRRQRKALSHWRRELAGEIFCQKFLQFQFFKQWRELKAYAGAHGVRIIGDIPIFVAHDSADVWSHPELFHLDDRGQPTVVAGVPPDYFSATGQLWGNPIYRWQRMAETGYAWWIARFRATLQLVDYIRLDHFRGFEKHWEIPAGEKTAVNGKWVEGPGARFFNAVREALGQLPIIAEDLGVITPEVEALREQFGFPGMKVLQFAFGHDERVVRGLIDGFPENAVIYTGTHDNDTTLGWFQNPGGRKPEEFVAERATVRKFFQNDDSEINWKLIEVAMKSACRAAIIPLQDLLGLGSEARMNLPGTTTGNWEWRFTAGMLTPQLRERFRALTVKSGRA